MILNFVNLWSKEVSVNIIHPSTVNKIDRYPDARIRYTSVWYFISIDKNLNNENRKIKIIQGGDINRILRSNNLKGKVEPYWKIVNKRKSLWY